MPPNLSRIFFLIYRP